MVLRRLGLPVLQASRECRADSLTVAPLIGTATRVRRSGGSARRGRRLCPLSMFVSTAPLRNGPPRDVQTTGEAQQVLAAPSFSLT